MKLEIAADLRRARMPPPAFYLDEAVYARVRDAVFVPSWQWLGPTDEVAAPRTLAPRTLLPGLVDEPLLLARDGAGTLRCLSNVCTHRALPLVGSRCEAAQIRCPYHGRRFALDGRVLGAPGFAPDDPRLAGDALRALPFATFDGHGFASLASAAPLAAQFDAIARRIGWLGAGAWRADPARERDYEVGAHWALYVENYLEGLHIPFIHPGLARTIEFAHYRYELHPGANLQIALARPGEPAFAPAPGHPDHGERIAAYYWWIFPNLMLNYYPWGLSVNLVLPQAPDRTRVQFRAYARDAAAAPGGAGGALDEVEAEDEAMVEAVQRGLRARAYRGGAYAPLHEAGVHQFHRLLAAALDRPAG
jgi:choline monooxygenase